MKVSIALATYNGEKYLQEQLNSFVWQTTLPDELVVCDDGSSDQTVAVLELFQKNAPFDVRLYKNPSTLGPLGNFAKCLSLCNGDVIFLSDQDDLWAESKISTCLELFEQNTSIYLIIHDLTLADKSLRATSYTLLNNARSLCLSDEKFVHGCGTIVKKAFLDFCLPIPDNVGAHDTWLNYLGVMLGVRLLSEQSLVLYRRHEGNASNVLANKLRKVSEIELVCRHGLRDVSNGWVKERERLLAVKTRIEWRAPELILLGLADRITPALTKLDRKIKAYEKRLKLVRETRLHRLPLVIRLWFEGGYRFFSGWKSAVKDILR